jgi:hypothetical protein
VKIICNINAFAPFQSTMIRTDFPLLITIFLAYHKNIAIKVMLIRFKNFIVLFPTNALQVTTSWVMQTDDTSKK